MTPSEQNAYARGYNAASRRVKELDKELSALRTLLNERDSVSPHDATIKYLINTAETLAAAAGMLIGMREPKHPEPAPETLPIDPPRPQ